MRKGSRVLGDGIIDVSFYGNYPLKPTENDVSAVYCFNNFAKKIKALQGARTPNLVIKSHTRYRLRQQGLLLLVFCKKTIFTTSPLQSHSIYDSRNMKKKKNTRDEKNHLT